jgi:hypothetical protein
MMDWISKAQQWVNQNFIFFLVLATMGIILVIGLARWV